MTLKRRIQTMAFAVLMAAAALPLAAQEKNEPPALTIYNKDFAVVRQLVPLDLKSGVNNILFTDATARIEPDSVILRDPSGRRILQVLEQNYRNDPVSQGLLLSLYEGQTIDFQVQRWVAGETHTEIVRGKIIRSGYVRGGGGVEPIIEVDGKMRFSLPGLPLFPSLSDGTVLKPTLNWLIRTDKPGAGNAELSYITGGMSWEADYNLVAPVKGDVIDLVGWVTMSNQTGKTFENARIKLLAGDVNKLAPNAPVAYQYAMARKAAMADEMAPAVREKAFDEFHLYTLQNATTLHDQETKQVEFVRGTGVKSQRIYVYEGFERGLYGYYGYGSANQDPAYGTQSNTKIWVMQEFKNTKENGLGIPLPKGRMRFYRRDDDGQLEFTGENEIDHTPADETVRVYTGNAFDIVGERRRTDFKVDSHRDWMDESFEIKVRNHKKEPVEVRVVERLYRWTNWQVTEKSNEYRKKDAQTIEFPVTIPADGEAVITYTVHYSW